MANNTGKRKATKIKGGLDMESWSEFLAANREKIYALADKNTQRNSDGQTVISRDDPWFYDDVWDNDYQELIAHEND